MYGATLFAITLNSASVSGSRWPLGSGRVVRDRLRMAKGLQGFLNC